MAAIQQGRLQGGALEEALAVWGARRWKRNRYRVHPGQVVVFGTGFVLGTVRVLLVVPRVGARTAELAETPVMVAASVLAACWTNRRFAADAGPWARLGIGLLALALLLAAEVALGVALRSAWPAESLLNRDPVAGTAYYLALLVFAILPWLLRLFVGDER